MMKLTMKFRRSSRPGLAARCALAVALAWELSAGAAAGAPARETSPARARAVIQVWIWGGLSQLDTFDPKPDAGSDYCGPYANPIETNVPGVKIGEKLPRLAAMADKYALIRSVTHGVNSHETASYIVQTGWMPGDGLVHPTVGAVVAYKNLAAGYTGKLPPYVTITESQGRFPEAGFLGRAYGPFCTGGDPAQTPFLVEGIVARGISGERQLVRRKLLDALNTLREQLPGNPLAAGFDRHLGEAYDFILGEEGRVFDLSEETDETREKYGRNTFGQSCLLARRLVERGVPFVTINYKGWDTHKQHFQAMDRKLPELDQGLSALLQELSDSGLLESTIVWCGGEFGHGPKIDREAPWNNGRSHWGGVFSVLVAGGGFQGGRVVGASDEKGAAVSERPVYPWDLIGSFYELLGIDPEGTLPTPEGNAVRLTPEPGSVKTGGRLAEIMK